MGHKVQQKKYVTKLIHSFIIKCGENVNTAAELSFKIIFSGVLCHVTIYWNCVCTSLFMLNSPVLVPSCQSAISRLQTKMIPESVPDQRCLSPESVTKAGSGSRSALL